MNSPLLKFAALFICSPLIGAETIVVSPPALGAHTHAIHDAIEAAAAGDVILLMPGAYGHHDTLEIDKPLTLMGAGSDITRFGTIANFPGDEPLPLYIHDLAAGEEVRVIGIELVSAGLGGLNPTVAVVADCAGPVVLADITGVGSYGSFGHFGLLRVLRSDQVLIDACVLTAGFSNSSLGPTGPALLLEDSQVHVNACTITGGHGNQLLGNGVPSNGTPAIAATGSEVRLSNSELTGGNGSDYLAFFDIATPIPNPEASPGKGAAAIEATASTIFIRGGSATTLNGGAGGQNLAAMAPIYSIGGAAVRLDSDSLASTTPGLALVPGLDGDGAGSATAFEGSGVIVPLSANLAQMTIAPSVASLGSPVSVNLGGEAGGIYLTYFSFAQGPAVGFAGIPGLSVLPISSLFSLPVKALGASGSAILGIHVPNNMSLAGTSLIMQGIALAPDATFSFSSPAQVAIVQ